MRQLLFYIKSDARIFGDNEKKISVLDKLSIVSKQYVRPATA